MIGDRWGVSEAEVARIYPCDRFVTDPALQAWRGVTVHASPEQVWPWLGQIRVAPYSYDWIDNLGARSPRTLLGLSEPTVGEPFVAAFRGVRAGRIRAVEPGVHLTGQILGALMSYVLVADGDRTRLLLKIVMARPRWLAPAVSAGDLVMARRQLLNLKRCAESSTRADRR